MLHVRSATLTHLNFVGVADLPTAGGSEKTLEFTTSSTSLSGFSFAVTRTGSTTEINTPWLGFPHGMTLYTTELCGQVEGIIPNICFTPDTASQLLLKLASLLGQAAPITLTNVTVDQLVIIASTMRTGPQTTGVAPR